MSRFRAVLALGLVAMAMGGAAQGAVVDIDFDGSGYTAGQQPPSPPWRQNAGHAVEAETGYLGTQGLVLRSNPLDSVFDLPVPLTSDMGAVTIAILFKPQGYPYNYGYQGGFRIAGAPSTVYGVTFRIEAGVSGIYGYPGQSSLLGTRMGAFSPFQWYLITIDIHEDWRNMTFRVGPIDQSPLSMTIAWTGHDITRFMLQGNQDSSRIAIYDNLSVTSAAVCPSSDLTGDCFVDMADFAVLAQWWLANCDASNDFCAGADFQSSGRVTVDDLLAVAIQWLEGERL